MAILAGLNSGRKLGSLFFFFFFFFFGVMLLTVQLSTEYTGLELANKIK
jgi:hypothetical protein